MRPLTRRRFLRESAGGALALGLPGLAAGCGGGDGGNVGSKGRVVVVGAGLAGLTAAYELDRAGWEVIVLEARARVGGRVRTIRAPFATGQHAEAGGEFIDTDHRWMRTYAERFGLALEDVRVGAGELDGLVSYAGRQGKAEDVVTAEEEDEIARWEAALDRLAEPLDPADPLAAGAALDRRSAADLLDEVGLDPFARAIVERELRDEYTVEPDRLSLLFAASLQALTAETPEDGIEAFRIQGGNAALPRAFAAELGDAIELEAPVTRIERRTGGVRVFVDATAVAADHVIVSVPLSALRGVEFSPPLPPAVAGAVARLQYGVATKTILQYARRFWREEGYSGDTFTDLTIGTTWEATNRQAGTPGILMGYTSGDAGVDFTDLPAPERIATATDELESLYPGSGDLRRGAFTAAWATEPYTRGTYTAYAPGQVSAYWRALRRPIGRLVLAGEHTSTYTSYMEGGVRSGRRAAAIVDARA